jgi:hypothetical protein
MRPALPFVALLAVSCGSKPAPVKAPDPVPTAAASSSTPATESSARTADHKPGEPGGVPGACAPDAADGCVMPRPFVKKLCAGSFPDLALALFSKTTPWRRAWVAVRQADPFNGFGGPSTDEKLLFDEELLVLTERKPNLGGMSVSGAGPSYDLLRWDGTCATLSAGEVTFRKPPKPRHANIPWRSLDDATQAALLQDDKVAKVAGERRKECKGATMGEVSAKCEKAERALNDLVADAVRGGVAVPTPKRLPGTPK